MSLLQKNAKGKKIYMTTSVKQKFKNLQNYMELL